MKQLRRSCGKKLQGSCEDELKHVRKMRGRCGEASTRLRRTREELEGRRGEAVRKLTGSCEAGAVRKRQGKCEVFVRKLQVSLEEAGRKVRESSGEVARTLRGSCKEVV